MSPSQFGLSLGDMKSVAYHPHDYYLQGIGIYVVGRQVISVSLGVGSQSLLEAFHIFCFSQLSKPFSCRKMPTVKSKAWLVLEDGTKYAGEAFGSNSNVSGTVVFNTGMFGHPEDLTDPTYRGQVVVLAYPIVVCCVPRVPCCRPLLYPAMPSQNTRATTVDLQLLSSPAPLNWR